MAEAPFYFTDLDGNPASLSPARYFVSGRTYRFPTGQRLGGDRPAAEMEPMWRDLLRLFVRLDYDFAAFESFLSHGIRELVLPFTSSHVKMSGGWIYSSGKIHMGLDFNDQPQRPHPYPEHPARTHFEVVAAADGTIVGWDETKLLTLEHVSEDGLLYRTVYNMMRQVPVGPVSSGGRLDLGGPVTAGQRIGEVWDPPGNPIHLHFGMALPQSVASGWSPDPDRVFTELSSQFGLSFTTDQQTRVLTRWSGASWDDTEWFFIDPFGLYDISKSSQASYGPVGRGFYYPMPPGVATYSFRDEGVGGDGGGDRIPLFASSDKLLEELSVGPLSMATLATIGE